MQLRAVGTFVFLVLTAAAGRPAAGAGFELTYQLQSGFNATEVQLLTTAYQRAETVWETVLTGYAPGVNMGPVVINIYPTTGGLAAAIVGGSSTQGGFTYSTSGSIFVNVDEIENFAAWPGVTSGPCLVPGTGLNYLDELLVHETGHVLGVGTQWAPNGVYVNNTFQYTGAHGLKAKQDLAQNQGTLIRDNSNDPAKMIEFMSNERGTEPADQKRQIAFANCKAVSVLSAGARLCCNVARRLSNSPSSCLSQAS